MPDFQFLCRGCIEEILVQALIPGYVYVDGNPDPITITMNLDSTYKFVCKNNIISSKQQQIAPGHTL